MRKRASQKAKKGQEKEKANGQDMCPHPNQAAKNSSKALKTQSLEKKNQSQEAFNNRAPTQN